ncbi:hypothetical protein [Geotalea toluenoxydans]|uniref:hypothetical protein n=1 Tax=Geotalea toluenoxydans TaxID=421624 RepID=UPI0006D13944|nr:hypothetical protein [Geotalea toluenoxydans]
MSSILKALKKVEEEKAAQRNAMPLASDVARNRRSRKSASFWKIPAALVVVAVTAILSTFAAMGGFTTAKTRPTTPPDVNGAVIPLAKGQIPLPFRCSQSSFLQMERMSRRSCKSSNLHLCQYQSSRLNSLPSNRLSQHRPNLLPSPPQ